MAIQTRKGPYNKFDPQKLLTGEWATVTEGDPNADDGRAVYMCFLPGIVKRMATYDDMEQNIEAAAGTVVDEHIKKSVGAAQKTCEEATQRAETAAGNAETIAAQAQAAAEQAVAAAKAAQEEAEKCKGLTDNSRVTALEEQVKAILKVLGNVLATAETTE